MPHIIVEYSKNLEGVVDISAMLDDMHDSLSARGIDKARIKTRGIALGHSVVGEGAVNEGQMAHITLLLLEGRDVETKQQYAKAIHETAKSHIHEKLPHCSVTMEVRDMAKDTYILG